MQIASEAGQEVPAFMGGGGGSSAFSGSGATAPAFSLYFDLLFYFGIGLEDILIRGD